MYTTANISTATATTAAGVEESIHQDVCIDVIGQICRKPDSIDLGTGKHVVKYSFNESLRSLRVKI